MEANTLLSFLTLSSSHHFLSNPPHNTSHHVLQLNNTSLNPQLHILCTTKYHYWPCNANNFNSQGSSFHAEEDVHGWEIQKKRMWWSDETEDEEEPDSVLDEFLDSIWILKVFKSFGWTLPPIILSLLLGTGLKAFLISLALPFGQSAFSFAFEKMWGQAKPTKKRKNRTRKTRFTGSTSDKDFEEKQEDGQESRTRKMGYQSWADGNAGSVNEGARETPSFGGWDELEGSRRRSRGPQISERSKRRTMNNMLTKKNRIQSPLLMRLLIAAFPFLSSWTKLFF